MLATYMTKTHDGKDRPVSFLMEAVVLAHPPMNEEPGTLVYLSGRGDDYTHITEEYAEFIIRWDAFLKEPR